MKITPCRILGLAASLTLSGLVPVHAQSEVSAETSASEAREIPLLSPEQLDELLGPIALYPDALVALMLPAATVPTDLVLASRYLGAGGEAAGIDEQNWDESVAALARYPEVVKWMDDRLSWSILVGDAFIAQPVDVMQSIQRLRARARAAGTLADSDEQKVVVEDDNIRIVPARSEVIYVPVYDPQIVYVERPVYQYRRPFVSFRWCYPTGIWLSYDCDWRHRRIWIVHSHYRHHWYHDGWWRHSYPGRSYHYDHDHGRGWSPRHDADRRRRDRDHDGGRRVVVVPGSAPRIDSRRDDDRRSRGDWDGDRDRQDRKHWVGNDGAGRNDRNDDNRRNRSGNNPERRGSSDRVSTPSSPPPQVVVRNPPAPKNVTPSSDGTARRWIGRANAAAKEPSVRSAERVTSSPAVRQPRAEARTRTESTSSRSVHPRLPTVRANPAPEAASSSSSHRTAQVAPSRERDTSVKRGGDSFDYRRGRGGRKGEE